MPSKNKLPPPEAPQKPAAHVSDCYFENNASVTEDHARAVEAVAKAAEANAKAIEAAALALARGDMTALRIGC